MFSYWFAIVSSGSIIKTKTKYSIRAIFRKGLRPAWVATNKCIVRLVRKQPSCPVTPPRPRNLPFLEENLIWVYLNYYALPRISVKNFLKWVESTNSARLVPHVISCVRFGFLSSPHSFGAVDLGKGPDLSQLIYTNSWKPMSETQEVLNVGWMNKRPEWEEEIAIPSLPSFPFNQGLSGSWASFCLRRGLVGGDLEEQGDRKNKGMRMARHMSLSLLLWGWHRHHSLSERPPYCLSSWWSRI